ncbi:hypothetical protein ACO0RG_003767 [Hanseniaspora osmophila]|uniref:Uncharacterized protein n=1 Tax=Hanseniaspora osmophila TaxID=56408 RepID=A0A1E5RF14_9ASCO|nr:hypothetical protein AWRI3579_g2409 [Hanseniaspora osmophila]
MSEFQHISNNGLDSGEKVNHHRVPEFCLTSIEQIITEIRYVIKSNDYLQKNVATSSTVKNGPESLVWLDEVVTSLIEHSVHPEIIDSWYKGDKSALDQALRSKYENEGLNEHQLNKVESLLSEKLANVIKTDLGASVFLTSSGASQEQIASIQSAKDLKEWLSLAK